MEKQVIYIMSDVRSGSTLLENILSKATSSISVGELHHLDSHLNKGSRGKSWQWKCSCGQTFDNCEFWTDIIEQLKARGIDSIKRTTILSGKGQAQCEKNAEVIQLLQAIYAIIFDNGNIQTIIDSSKNPEQGLALYKSIDNIKVIYIKRDIRAVALSKLKWLKKNFNISASIYRLLIRSKLYDRQCLNSLKEIAESDKISISYEQLSKAPQETINRITNKFNLPPIKVQEYMYLVDDHTIGGTPNRFERRKIKYDASWEEQVSRMPFFNLVGKLIDKI